MWKVVIEDDEGKRTVVPLTRDQYTIGRKDGNAIRLTERNVSREHARIYKKNGVPTEKPTFVLEDLTSYNGVFVNGLRITHAQALAHGDLVQIGDYRIILQDEVVAEAPAPDPDAKQTVPIATTDSRAAQLLERPHRFVMLAGPTPGTEYPLDQERLTIGRAEDAGISVNHNSVSRLHCEVHSLGEGRFEIVDKGSSNGVRVNGADLRRGIIEPGDVIELGDVKFKFVGAGQVFRPTESQRLAAISDRAADEIIGVRRGYSALPIAIFAVVVAAGAAGAWVYTRPRAEPNRAARASAPTSEQAALDDAKKLCAAGDCEAAHDKLRAAIGQSSPLWGTAELGDIESKWADRMLARADTEPDVAQKRTTYQRVAEATSIDPARRKIAADKLQQLDMSGAALAANPPQPQPAASAGPGTSHSDEGVVSSPSRPDAGRRAAAIAAAPAAPAEAPAPQPAIATPPAAKTSGMTADDRERQLALQGTQDSKMLLKQQLELRVFSGKASETEIKLLISTCKDLGDKSCVQAARATLAQKQGN
jgi:pSer/pThr/pTyr-binding forkhead associated (FHA) protein